MSSTSGDSDSGKDKRPVKRGKGRGGQKARHATQISPAARVAQYPDSKTNKFKYKPVSVLFDEYTGSRGAAVLATIVRSYNLKFCDHVQFLEGRGPNNGTMDPREGTASMQKPPGPCSTHAETILECF